MRFITPRKSRRTSIGFSLAILAVLPLLHGQPQYGNADSITEDELKIYLYFLASDQTRRAQSAVARLRHRGAVRREPSGRVGTEAGRQHQRHQWSAATLSDAVRAGDQAGDRRIESKALLTARGARRRTGRRRRRRGRGGRPAPPISNTRKDWTVPAGGRGAPPLEAFDVEGKLVFAGNGYVINKTNIDPYQGLDVNGQDRRGGGTSRRTGGAAGEAGGGGGRGPNPLGETCTDFLTPEECGGEEWRDGRGHARQISSSSRPWTIPMRRSPGSAADGTRAERSQLSGAEVARAGGVSGGSGHHRPDWRMTNAIFPGREEERLGDFLCRRRQRQAGFVRAERRQDAQAACSR